MQEVQQLKQERGVSASLNGASRPPAAIETVVDIISSPPQSMRPGEPAAIELARAKRPLMGASRDGGRSLIGSGGLELAITEAVRKGGTGCEAFVGVIVQQTRPKSRFDANWAVRGVKFGRADRDKANEAIATIVERMQREFRLSGD
jgi:hypothetical protein